MKSSVEKLSATSVKLTVTVPFDELTHEIDQAYAAIAQQVTIPGFRKGKAPRQLIDARFGRGPILEQVVNDMLPSRYQQAVVENELTPLGQPEIEVTRIEDKELVEFVASLDVAPEITLPDFSEVSVTVPTLEVSDDAIDEEIEHLRVRFAELKDKKEGKPLKKGNFALIDVVAEVDGERYEDACAEGISYELGSEELYEGLDDALTGLSAGEDTEFETTLATDERGTVPATLKVHVEAVKKRVLPEVDEEFVQLASEFDTVEELREGTRKDLTEKRKQEQATALRDKVLESVLEDTSFELPERIVEQQVRNQLQQLLGQMANDESTLNYVLEQQGTSREDFDAEQRSAAEKAVRTQLFLDALAEQEQPEVSRDDMAEHIMYTAMSYGMDPNQFVEQVTRSGQIASLAADVRRGKALAAAICRVSATDEDGAEIDPREYFGEETEGSGSEDAEAASDAEESPDAQTEADREAGEDKEQDDNQRTQAE